MDLFGWIGEALGGAFSALAEFFGDSFGGLFKTIGGAFLDIGKENLGKITGDIADKESTAKTDIDKVISAIEAPIKEGFEHHLREFDKKHSEIPIEEIDKEVTTLWNDVKAELAASAGIATLIEAISFGQIEGGQNILKVADTTRGLTSFANQVSMIRLKAIYLNMYQRYQNQANPTMLPGSGDLVRSALREVWDPTRREELLREQAPSLYYKFMGEQGYNFDRAADYWAAHWVLPSVGQLNEMLHRRVITPEDWDRFVRYNDFDPEVRPWLKAISFKPYTRVDIRRMKDLELVTDQEVLDNYKDLGYDDEHAERMTIWTKAYIISVEMRARYSKGWVTPDVILGELIAAGVPESRAKIWIQRIVKADQEERTAKERDLTKAEIVKGVKEAVLSVEEAIELLIDMGYDRDEAEYIIAINVEVMTGSPKTLEEFQKIVDLRRKALGLPVKEHPKEPTNAGEGTEGNKSSRPSGEKNTHQSI